jgi:hypothetical protein
MRSEIDWFVLGVWLAIGAFALAVWSGLIFLAHGLGGWNGVGAFVMGLVILAASFAIATIHWRGPRKAFFELWAATAVAITTGLILGTIFVGPAIPLKVWWWPQFIMWCQQWLFSATIFGALAVGAFLALTCRNEKEEARNA